MNYDKMPYEIDLFDDVCELNPINPEEEMAEAYRFGEADQFGNR